MNIKLKVVRFNKIMQIGDLMDVGLILIKYK